MTYTQYISLNRQTKTMKFAIALYCFLLLAFNTQALPIGPEIVVDMQGNLLEPKREYYVLPHWTDFGGLKLGQTRNKTCHLDVLYTPTHIHSLVTFSAPAGLGYISTLTDLTIELQMKTICDQPTV